jgi:lipoyl(octanoyl) transferase
MTDASPGPLEVFLLGEISIDDALSLQRRLIYDQGERAGGGLILCEHPPSITVGRGGSRSHIRPDDDELRDLRLPVRWVNRGGGCLLHLRGQLAGYLVVSLANRDSTVGLYVRQLEKMLVGVLAEFDLKGEPNAERPGIFLQHGRVASIGIAVSRGIAYHGFTLNVGTYLAPFQLLNEPGLDGWPLRQTSMEAQRQRTAPMAKVRESVIRHVELELGLARHHVYTDHPLLRPKVRPHVTFAHLG